MHSRSVILGDKDAGPMVGSPKPLVGCCDCCCWTFGERRVGRSALFSYVLVFFFVVQVKKKRQHFEACR